MKLNMGFAADELDDAGIAVVDAAIPSGHACPLVGCLAYNAGLKFRDDILYVALSQDLPSSPEWMRGYPHQMSLFCIGAIPESYQVGWCHYVCVDESNDLNEMLELMMKMFARFNAWEDELRNGVYRRASFHEMGEMLFKVSDNPVFYSDPFFKNLFVVYDKDRELPPGYLEEYHEGEYLPDDERGVLVNNQNYYRAMAQDNPTVFPAGMYSFEIIYYDIYHEGEYLGRVMMDEVYKPAKRSDAEILIEFGRYFEQSYLDQEALSVGRSREFDHMIQELDSGGIYYGSSYDTLLTSYQWKRRDSFIACRIVGAGQNQEYAHLTKQLVYLHHLMDNCYPIIIEQGILLIVNLDNLNSSTDMMQKLENFARMEDAAIGISEQFDDFAKLAQAHIQAKTAVRVGKESALKGRVYEYEPLVLDAMLSVISENPHSGIFVSKALSAIVEYDKEHGTELIETLKVALKNNMNATDAARILNIYRTTYLYRIRRIQEISGFELEDYRTRLYLSLVFEAGIM